MKAAVINKKQKYKTLSSKIENFKKKIKNASRLVLSSSVSKFNFKGYTVLKDKSVELEDKLSQIFQYQPPKTYNWSVLKSYSKEERRELKKPDINYLKYFRQFLVLGFNEVTRAMETRTAKVIILSDDMNPTLLYTHFYQCCDIYKIPLLKVKNLREMLKRCIGVASMAMAIKEAPKEHEIYKFYKYLENLFPTEWERTRTKPELKEMDIINLSDEEIKPVPVKTVDKKTENGDTSEDDVYLYRDNKEKRCFVVSPPMLEKTKAFSADFVAFTAEPAEENVIPIAKEKRKQLISNFKLKLKMKRLQANSDRNKK